MTSSLHVSVPDEMRTFVNQRTSGEAVYSTPSEYVRALIRDDMEKEAERLDVYQILLHASDEIDQGRVSPESTLDEIMKEFE